MIGHVGRDPECSNTRNDTMIAKFSMATTDRRRKGDDGKPATEWHNIVAWGKLAEIIQLYVVKGKLLYVEGTLRTSSWEDRETGAKKYKTEIHIDQMEMLGGRDEDTHRGGQYPTLVTGDDTTDGGDVPFALTVEVADRDVVGGDAGEDPVRHRRRLGVVRQTPEERTGFVRADR